MWILLAGLSGALAAEHHLVRPGESLASIAEERGDAGLAAQIARLNGLSVDAELIPGTILDVPDRDGAVSPHPAHVASLTGSGRLYLDTGQQVSLERGMDISIGAVVCTDTSSTARIRLARAADSFEHDEINLMPETCLRIEGLVSDTAQRASTVSLEQGSVSVRASSTSGQVILRSEDGVMVGESGGFRVTLEDEATRAEALTGPISMLGGGEEVQLAINEGSRVRAGEAPEAPTTLPAAGRLERPGDGAVLIRPSFQWTAVPGALGYRIELASDPEFSDLLLIEDVPDAEWSPQMLFLPFRVPGVWWRVSTFDRVGFLGGSGEIRAIEMPAGVGP